MVFVRANSKIPSRHQLKKQMFKKSEKIVRNVNVAMLPQSRTFHEC